MSGPNSFYLYPTLTHSWMGMKTSLDRYDTTGLEDGVWSHMLIGYIHNDNKSYILKRANFYNGFQSLIFSLII